MVHQNRERAVAIVESSETVRNAHHVGATDAAAGSQARGELHIGLKAYDVGRWRARRTDSLRRCYDLSGQTACPLGGCKTKRIAPNTEHTTCAYLNRSSF